MFYAINPILFYFIFQILNFIVKKVNFWLHKHFIE